MTNRAGVSVWLCGHTGPSLGVRGRRSQDGLFPAVLPWCVCVNDQCVPSPVTINALRLTTPDGRAVGASAATGGLLVAKTVVPAQNETFLFAPPTAFPLRSGDSLSLVMCDATWASSGLLVLVDHNVVTFGGSHSLDPGQKSAPIA